MGKPLSRSSRRYRNGDRISLIVSECRSSRFVYGNTTRYMSERPSSGKQLRWQHIWHTRWDLYLRGGQGTSSIRVFRKDATMKVIRFSPLHALIDNLPIHVIPNLYPQATFCELFPDRLPIHLV